MHPLSKHPNWTGAASAYPYDKGIEAALTFTSKYGDEVSMTRRDGAVLFVPRKLAPSTGHDYRTTNYLGATDCKCPPRDQEQADCIAQSLELLTNDQSHVLEAPTGFGKTYLGSSIAAQLGQATLIVVPKADLMPSWRDTLVNLIGIPAEAIGIAQADKLKYKGCRFVLGMLQSLVRPGKYDSEFWNYFGLMIVDETHRVAADTFQSVNFLCPAKYRLGLSATPKRSDGKTPVIAAHIGPVLVRGAAVPMKPKIIIEKTGWTTPGWMKIEPGKMMGVYNEMAKNLKRNGIAINFTKSALNAGRTVVLMADTLSHLDTMSNMLIQAGVSPDDIGFYTGSTPRPLLKINAQKRVILATYGMCSEGTDYPAWDTLVMLTPRANVKQPLGRILRKKAGKKQPVCLDLVDNGSIYGAFSYKRLQQYYELGAEIIKV